MARDSTQYRFGDLSRSTEDYLRAMLIMEESGEQITTHLLAGRQGVSAPSATQKVHHLASLGLVTSTPYGPTRLTRDGRNAAANVMQRYELARAFLTTVLGYSPDVVDAEANNLEHALSPKLQSRIMFLLQNPDLSEEERITHTVTPVWPSLALHQIDDPHTDPG